MLQFLPIPDDPLCAFLRAELQRLGVALQEVDPLCHTESAPGDLVLARLTAETVCQVYAGVCIQPVPARVLHALVHGRRVWCPQEGLETLGTGPLGRSMTERLWVLRRSGLTLCPLHELVLRLSGGSRRGTGRR